MDGNFIFDQTGQLPIYAVARRLAMVNAGGDYGNITIRDQTEDAGAGVLGNVAGVQ